MDEYGWNVAKSERNLKKNKIYISNISLALRNLVQILLQYC